MTQQQYEPTTDARSEQRLARSLGYPATWHVVRSIVPDPTNASNASSKLVQDRIYAGDPAKNADLYYNHGAAFAAASNWVEGESTPYDDEGGQMLPRIARYSRGEEVEVLYDDGEWYGAIIKKVNKYPDDIRYTVLYTAEDTYQNNVTEDEMRLPVTKAGKAKAAASSKKKRKAGGGGGGGARSHPADPAELELASEMGLPDGWMAKENKNSRYVFRSPDGKHKFQSKKAVYEFLGISAPPAAKKARKAKTPPKVQEEEEEDMQEDTEEEDPPWRLDGHEFIGKRVRYRSDGGEQTGMVVGWISETDVDKAGDPGFVSEITGKPAALFHVEFDEVKGGGSSLLDYQDFEEYELLDCFIDVGGEKQEEAAAASEAAEEADEGAVAAAEAAKGPEEEDAAAAAGAAKKTEEEVAEVPNDMEEEAAEAAEPAKKAEQKVAAAAEAVDKAEKDAAAEAATVEEEAATAEAVKTVVEEPAKQAGEKATTSEIAKQAEEKAVAAEAAENVEGVTAAEGAKQAEEGAVTEEKQELEKSAATSQGGEVQASAETRDA